MRTVTDVADAIAKMNATYPRPGIAPLCLSDRYDVRTEFAKSYPGASSCGVYVLFSANDELLYVGKASSGLGVRLGAHFRRIPESIDRGTSTIDEFADVAIVRTIALSEGHEFEAPAIEACLIQELAPRLNRHGVRDRDGKNDTQPDVPHGATPGSVPRPSLVR